MPETALALVCLLAVGAVVSFIVYHPFTWLADLVLGPSSCSTPGCELEPHEDHWHLDNTGEEWWAV